MHAICMRIFLGLVLLAAGWIPPAAGAWISTGGPAGARVDIRLLEAAPERTVLEITVPGFEAVPVTIGERTYYRLALPGGSNFLKPGLPELPRVCRSLLVPDGASLELTVLAEETVEFALPVVPSKGNLPRTVDPGSVPYEFSSFYASSAGVGPGRAPGPAPSSALWPESPARLGEPYILRDCRGVVVEAHPFRATADGRLVVATRLRLEVAAPGVEGRTALRGAGSLERPVSAEFAGLYAKHFLNYAALRGPAKQLAASERGAMLIVCHDPFLPELAPFVEWKRQSGIPVEVVPVSAVGNNVASIGRAIRERYEAGGLAYVLLVGDAEQIATPSAMGGSSDPTYALVAGEDIYPDLLIGRFSAETPEHVRTQVRRTIAYERDATPDDDWYARATGVASHDGPGDDEEFDHQHSEVIRGKLLAYGYEEVDQIYAPSGNIAMIRDALNTGRGLLNYTGQGTVSTWSTTSFSNADIAALTNEGKLPFLCNVACWNGKYAGRTCFAEAWVRSERDGAPIGAVAVYMSSIAQPWRPPMAAQDAIVELMLAGEPASAAGLCFAGSCAMIDEYGSEGAAETSLSWHIFGDPSLLVRTKPPRTMTVEHAGELPLGAEAYAVTVPGVAGARCALWGEGRLLGVAYTDEAGAAELLLDPPPQTTAPLLLTVVAQDRVAVQEPVGVLPAPGPYLVPEVAEIADPAGDGDGRPESGELIELAIRLRNTGTAAAHAVTATLGGSDPYVRVVTRGRRFGAAIPADSASSAGVFTVRILPGAPDGHVAPLRLLIAAEEGSWEEDLPFATGAPVLTYAFHDVDDAPPDGNGTGWVEPGETIAVTLTLENAGRAEVRDLELEVDDGAGLLEIVEGRASCEEVPSAGSAVLTPLRLRVRPGCPSPAVIPVTATYTAGDGIAGEFTFQVPVGGFADDGEAECGWTCGLSWDDAIAGGWRRGDPVGTTHLGQPAQPEDDHTPGSGTQCFVTGLGRPGDEAEDSDLDGGRTTLLSPVFDLSRAQQATISYWFWFTNDPGEGPPNNCLRVEATGDGSWWAVLDEVTVSTGGWVERTYNLRDYVLLTSRVQIRFVAEDNDPGSLVEALVDDFLLVAHGTTAGLEAGPGANLPDAGDRFALLGAAPNPCSGVARIAFAVPAAGPVTVDLFDVSGRLVRRLIDRTVPGGTQAVVWDGRGAGGRKAGSGLYFIRMRARGFNAVRPLTWLE